MLQRCIICLDSSRKTLTQKSLIVYGQVTNKNTHAFGADKKGISKRNSFPVITSYNKQLLYSSYTPHNSPRLRTIRLIKLKNIKMHT